MKNQDKPLDRLLDAEILWRNDRKAGAFVLGLIALAGVSRRRYPKTAKPKVYYDKMRKCHPNQAARVTMEEKRYREERRKRNAEGKRVRREELSDGQAFKCLLLDLIPDIILPTPKPGIVAPTYNIHFPFGTTRKDTNIEEIFYKWFRCTFVHEGTLTTDAYLTPRTELGDEVHLTQPTGVPEGWIRNLLVALSKTPELT